MSIEFKKPHDLLKAYRDGFLGSWCDPKDLDKLLGELPHPLFGAAAYDLYESGKGKLALPFKNLLKFDPGFGPAEKQVQGDCVSMSTRNAVDVTRSCEIINGEREDFVARGAVEGIYGSRGHGGEGMTCSGAVRFVNKTGGILIRRKYGSIDLSQYSNVGGRWGRSGVPAELINEAQKHQVKTVSLINTVAQARDALANGYAISVCSMSGFSSRRDKYGIAARSGSWAHAMCVPSDTDILTKRGWISVSEMNQSDIFCTLNPKTHEIEWQQANKILEFDFEGDLYNFKNKLLDIAVTPEHRMYGVINNNFIDNDNIENYQFVEAMDTPKNLKVKFTANYSNHKVLKYKFNKSETIVDMDLWLEFLGYFLSEGCCVSFDSLRHRKDRNNNPYVRKVRRVEISQTKIENLDKIQQCLDSLPFNFTRSNGKWVCEQQELNEELQHFGKAHEKYIPEYVWDCGKDQLIILANALMLGDGHVTKDNEYHSYTTTSKKLADNFQQLMLFIGLSAKITKYTKEQKKNSFLIRDIYTIYIRSKVSSVQVGKPDLIPHNGKVYCPSTDNGIIFIRRNGIPSWTGNCWIAMDDTHEIYNETLFLVQNSWGIWNGGPKRHDQPEGSFWIRERDAGQMLSENGSWVFSDVDGFPPRNVDWTLDKIF